jgi:ATP/maltotriose-dependent transcriptional regulator MalT
MARSAVEQERAASDPLLESEVRGALVEVLLAQGEVSEAKREIELALSHAAEMPWWYRVKTSVIAAHVRAASGQSADAAAATSDLRAILEEARKKDALQIQFWARLALGEIEIASGNREAGRAELAALEKDARAKGFLLIAGRASTALAKHS